jgi:hypothetical protein
MAGNSLLRSWIWKQSKAKSLLQEEIVVIHLKTFYDQAEMYKRSIQRRFILQRRYTEACEKIYHPGE